MPPQESVGDQRRVPMADERAFAQQGADVIGIDIAEAQIVTAQQLATQEHLDIRFMTCAAEPVPSWATWASCASAVFPYRANPMPPV